MDYIFLSILVLGALIFLAHYPLLVLPALAILLFLYAKRAAIVAKWEELRGSQVPSFLG